VVGTQEVLRLACLTKTKPVHYVSSLSVFPFFSLLGDVVYDESDELVSYQFLFDGYSQSKWVAEKLVKEAGSRGLPYTICRPGRITGDSKNGIGEADDLMWTLIQQCLLIGAVPAIDISIDMTPVDYVSQAIVQLGSNAHAWNRAYHLVNPQPMAWGQFITLLRDRGYQLTDLSISDWKRAMKTSAQDQRILNLLDMVPEELIPTSQENQIPRTAYSAQNALNLLAPLGIHCPPADDRLVGMYLDQFKCDYNRSVRLDNLSEASPLGKLPTTH
jgi:myxalamid-type nonribosomal peptide synthetase MxaA